MNNTLLHRLLEIKSDLHFIIANHENKLINETTPTILEDRLNDIFNDISNTIENIELIIDDIENGEVFIETNDED